MFERQLGVEGWKFRTPFISVSDGAEKQREEQVTRTVEKNRKLRIKKDTTESKEGRKEGREREYRAKQK
jgi:hypothetical protein